MTLDIIDNFLDQESYEVLRFAFTEGTIPWNWANNVTMYSDKDTDEIGQFEHMMYIPNRGVTSNAFPTIHPILDEIQRKYSDFVLFRIKANLNPKQDQNYRLGDFHVDFKYDIKTAIYYINTNNGYTEFENGDRVESVANRIVIFDANNPHVGYSCTDKKTRVLINFNFAIPV